VTFLYAPVPVLQVPTYLLQRKLQLAQEHEARMAAKAAAAIPAGAHPSSLGRSLQRMTSPQEASEVSAGVAGIWTAQICSARAQSHKALRASPSPKRCYGQP
jgi:hypothetical protein